jgi:4-amino-4-deoxy-L-arabinose transferase
MTNAGLPLLVLAFIAVLPVALGTHGLWIPDETRYAQISQQMLLTATGVAALHGHALFREADCRLLDDRHRPGLFGENLFGVRIASAIATGLSVCWPTWSPAACGTTRARASPVRCCT